METVNAKTAVTLVCLGFILIGVSIPLFLGKIKMNYFYGFRIGKAFESEENWYAINRYGAKALMCWSVVIMAVGIVSLYLDPQHVLTVAKIAFLSLLVPVVQTLWYARRL
ncbi:MAG: SdpI family protein [Desulfomonile tiedjei]|nr:SdpI family protein [Desulfomonile tiedjei]